MVEFYIWGKIFSKNFVTNKNDQKVRDHCHFTGIYRGASHSICNIKVNMPKEITSDFDDGSNYHLNINELANLSFYYKKISKQVWRAISTSWENLENLHFFCRKISYKNKLQKSIKMVMKVLLSYLAK